MNSVAPEQRSGQALQSPTVVTVADSTAGGRLWPSPTQFSAALEDIVSACRDWRMWSQLAYQEIRMRYRRTALGPFWITLNMGLTVVLVGVVFGRLFNSNPSEYMTNMVTGVVLWNALTMTMNESASGFISFAGYIKQVKQPYFIYILVIFWRNILTFFHNLIIIPCVMLFFLTPVGWTVLLVPVGLVLFFLALMPYALIAALLSARFRDVPQFVSNILSSLFFVSPIIWKVDLLGHYAKYAYLNPITHLIDVVREPLLGKMPIWFVYPAVLFMIAVGWAAAFIVFARFRARIPYWV